jgi:hypothetical protein
VGASAGAGFGCGWSHGRMSILTLARRRVVLLPFPFSDLSAQKLRPAKLVTAHSSLIRAAVGELSPQIHQRVCAGLMALLSDDGSDAASG